MASLGGSAPGVVDGSLSNTLNNQGEPPEVIDNTQESPSTITNPSGIILDENGKKTESHFSPNFDISQNLLNKFMTTHLFHKSYYKMTLQILLRLHVVMSEVTTSPQQQTNFPLSPLAQSHFLFSQVIVQDGYDSDAGVDHNVATNLEGPQEIDEIDIPQVGDDDTASKGVDEAQSSDNFVSIPPC